jgi:hypothetical protein
MYLKYSMYSSYYVLLLLSTSPFLKCNPPTLNPLSTLLHPPRPSHRDHLHDVDPLSPRSAHECETMGNFSSAGGGGGGWGGWGVWVPRDKSTPLTHLVLVSHAWAWHNWSEKSIEQITVSRTEDKRTIYCTVLCISL